MEKITPVPTAAADVAGMVSDSGVSQLTVNPPAGQPTQTVTGDSLQAGLTTPDVGNVGMSIVSKRPGEEVQDGISSGPSKQSRIGSIVAPTAKSCNDAIAVASNVAQLRSQREGENSQASAGEPQCG